MHLNAAAGGSILNVIEARGREIIEAMAKADRNGFAPRSQLPKAKGVLELQTFDAILAQNKLLTQGMEGITKTLEKLAINQQQVKMVAQQPQFQATCELCGGGHVFANCPHATSKATNEEQANYVSNQGRPGNFSNPPFRTNNFSSVNQGWKPNQPQGGPSSKPPFVPLVERTSKLEDTLEKFISVSMANQQGIEAFQKNTEASIRNLETQVGQISKQLAEMNTRPFSANTSNPGKEHCNVISTRSGKLVGSDVGKNVAEKEKTDEGDEEVNEGESDKSHVDVAGRTEESEMEIVGEKNPREKKMSEAKKKVDVTQLKEVPYPLRPSRKDTARKYARFLDIFKHLQINLPFLEAMEEMPVYAKFMKDLLTKKKKFKEEIVELEAGCSAIIQKTLPHKMKDPGSFTIPVTIGEVQVGKALMDLGASINLMPLSMMRRIGDIQVKPTKMTLQLADRSLKFPFGVAEDVLVRVDKFVFPADFVIMDIEEDLEVPLILGRPFMKTARVIIDVDKGHLKLRVEEDEVVFDVFEAMKYPKEKLEAFRVDVVDDGILLGKSMSTMSPLEKALVQANEDLFDIEERDISTNLELLGRFKNLPENATFEELPEEVIKEEPKLELKVLPSHLKYAFLGESVDISAIISDELHHRALSKKEERASIGFPALITELCRRSGVPRIQATTPIYDPITDHFITTVKREAARATEQAPPPPQQQAPPQAPVFDPSAPVTMERFTQMMNQMRISHDHLFLQNTALMRGQMHQQEAAYAWMEKHHAGDHSWMSPEAFTIHTAWPGDRPFYPEEGETHGAAAGDDDQDDDADDADDDGGDYGDIGADLERDAHCDPFA